MTKPYITSVLRNVGHPYTGEPGWDLMFVLARDVRTASAFRERAQKIGWRVLMRGRDGDPHGTGEGLPMLAFYKPTRLLSTSGAYDWIDPWPWPYPCDWF